MEFTPIEPPREFIVGLHTVIMLKDCARVRLEPDELVTFMTESGGEYDVIRKSWGFYATPSINQRLPKFGLRAVLGKSIDGKFYVFLVERGKDKEFEEYANAERVKVVSWLYDDIKLQKLERLLENL